MTIIQKFVDSQMVMYNVHVLEISQQLFYVYVDKGRCSGLMQVSALISGWRVLPGEIVAVVFLGKTIFSHSVSLPTQVCIKEYHTQQICLTSNWTFELC